MSRFIYCSVEYHDAKCCYAECRIGWRHGTQHNDIQHNDTQNKGLIRHIQQNDNQHNNTQHNGHINDIQHNGTQHSDTLPLY